MTLQDRTDQDRLIGALPSADIHLAFAWRREPPEWRVERLTVEGQLSERLRSISLAAANDVRENRAEISYDAEIPLPENQYFIRDNAPVGSPSRPPVGGNLFSALDDFGQLGVYGQSERRSSPNLHAILAQLDDGTVAKFGRRLTARQQIKASRWVRIFWTGEAFDLLRDGPLLTLDPGVDWIEWLGTIVVVDTQGFHSSFRSVAELRAAVKGHVDAITDRIGIKNADRFVERCQRMPSMASKLDSVVQQELYKKPVEELKAYSTAYPGLGVDWQGEELIFSDDLAKQWAILRLLDEAGFTGVLSGHQFEAPTKREL